MDQYLFPNSTELIKERPIREEYLRLLPLYVVLTVLIVVLNVVVFWGFSFSRKKTFSNHLFLSIAASDLIAGAIRSPLTTVGLIYPHWPLGHFLCYLSILMAKVNFIVSDICLLILSVYRFLQITRPCFERRTMSSTKTLVLASPWLVAFGFNIGTLVGYFSVGRVDTLACRINKSPLFDLLQSVFLFLAPLTATIVFNVLNIHFLFKKNRCARTASLPRLSLTPSLFSAVSAQSQATSARRSSSILHRRHSRNKKALLCIVALIGNVMLTQYLSNVVFIYSLYSESYIDWFVQLLIGAMDVFPIGNTLIVFAFHRPFRKDLVASFKKSKSAC